MPPYKFLTTSEAKNEKCWTDAYYKPLARNAALAEVDIPFWDIYPQCYDFVTQSGRPVGWFNRDGMHNNERGKAVIARIMLNTSRLPLEATRRLSRL